MSDSFTERAKKKAEEAKSKLQSVSLPAPDNVNSAFSVMPSPPLSVRIKDEIDTRNTEKPGILAFFSRKGEEARRKLAEAQAGHARAITDLEKARQDAIAVEFDAQQQQKDLIRKKIIEVEQAKLVLVTAQTQSELLQVRLQLAQSAASRGFTLETDEEIRRSEKEIEHELHKIEKQAEIELKKLERQNELARQDEAERARTKIEVMTTASMADLQQEQQVLEALDRARVKRHSIESGDDPETLKAQRLQDQDEYITSLQERLRGFRQNNRKADSGQDA